MSIDMNIQFDRAEGISPKAHTNIDRDTTSNSTRISTGNVQNSGFALDISGTVMDNSAYAGHGRTAEEVMLEAGQEDITARRNYMAVMSNCTSDEDFAKLNAEGFHPGSTEIETVVTIVDHIKAEMMKGGTQVVGYTDTISKEALQNITGSEVFADRLQKEFAKRDIPVTKENVTAVMDAWNSLSQVGDLTEGSVKYMIENNLPPTSENLYTARFSALQDGSRQGKGYYAAGNVAGYYAKKPEQIDFEKLLPQMTKVIEEAGFLADAENIEGAKWLVEKGIPLNTDTFSAYKGIDSLHFPISVDEFLQTAASAVADGKSPAKADLNQKNSALEQAVALAEKTKELTEEAADVITSKNLPFTLKNLFVAWEMLQVRAGTKKADAQTEVATQAGMAGDARLLAGRRMLEEVRLSMTVEANLKLLRSGYQIETAPLEELIGKLKEAEVSYEMALSQKTDAKQAAESTSLFKESLHILQSIQSSPAAIVAQISETDTLTALQVIGQNRSLAYQRAGETYEALMTAPRKDLGDTIQKAFRNVDDILTDMDFALTDENRRTVRILGYNNMDITQENIRKIREKDELLTKVVEEMKPGRVLQMIREDMNPVNMPLNELQEYLQQQADPAQEMESYSKFLYKLEKQNGITEEERSAYIGVYRLLRQIEKGDDAAIGAVWQSGAEFTLENLLTAVRSSKRGRMDYSVDDSFGGVTGKESKNASITEQLAKGFSLNTSSDIKQLQQELEQVIENAGQEEAAKEFEQQTFEQIRKSVKILTGEEAVLQQLTDYGLPVTADTITAAKAMLKEPGSIWKKVKDAEETEGETADNETSDSSLEHAGEEITKSLSDKESAQGTYQNLVDMVQDMIGQSAYMQQDSLDVRALSSLYKQMSFMGSMAREENYEIPVNIDGSLTSINLKLIHNTKEESKAMINFESLAFGKTSAEFKLTGQEITGFCICTSKEGTEYLRNNKESLEERLEREDIPAGEIYFATGDNLNLEEISLRETKGRKQADTSKILYRTARAFIGFVQEMGIKKGNEVYED